MSFRFPFFGARPTDWHTDVHPYRVVFAKAPDDVERRALAATVARFSARHPETPLGAWSWSGRQARFAFEPVTGDDHDGFFITVEELMTSLHRTARIAEVIHESARGGSSAWDAWTEAKGKPPTATPAGAWATDAAFEAARVAQRADAEAAVQAGANQATEAREQLERARAAVAEITHVPAPGRTAPVIAPPPELAAKFEAAGPPRGYLHAGETWVGLLEKGLLYVHTDGSIKKRAFKTLCRAGDIAISPSGATVSVVGMRSSTIRFPGAKLVEVIGMDSTSNVAYIAEDRVVCVNTIGKTLLLRSLDGRTLDTVAIAASHVFSLSGARVHALAMALDAEGAPTYATHVYALRDDRLVLVAAGEATHAQQLWEEDDRMFAVDIRQRPIEILGLS